MKTAIARITRALSTKDDGHGSIHFHAGTDGAYVCENPHCVSPGLSPAEVT